MNSTVDEDIAHVLGEILEGDGLRGASVLVTGCAGFLGFTCLHFLVGQREVLGIRGVIGLDNFQLGRPAWLDALVSESAILDIRTFDIARDSLDSIESVADVDYVLHMASIASPTYYRKHPLETVDANVWGLRRLLDFYRSSSLKGLLFFSSSEVYRGISGECGHHRPQSVL